MSGLNIVHKIMVLFMALFTWLCCYIFMCLELFALKKSGIVFSVSVVFSLLQVSFGKGGSRSQIQKDLHQELLWTGLMTGGPADKGEPSHIFPFPCSLKTPYLTPKWKLWYTSVAISLSRGNCRSVYVLVCLCV